MKLIELIRDFGRWIAMVAFLFFGIIVAGFCLKFFYNIFMIGWRLL
jgi:hypothetical protein